MDFSNIDNQLNELPGINVIAPAVYFISCFLLLIIGRFVYKALHPKINMNHELVEKDNFAYSISMVGYFIGVVMTMAGALIGESKGLMTDLVLILVYGGTGIVLLNISMFINDKFILHKFNVKNEIIENQNLSVGAVEGASMIASGLIIMSTLLQVKLSYLEVLLVWAIGEAVLIASIFVYEKVLRHSVHGHIENRNLAAGVSVSGVLIALSILVTMSLLKTVYYFDSPLANVGIFVLIGFIGLPLIRIFCDKILLPGQKLTQEIYDQEKPNVGAACIEAFSYISSAFFISWCL